LPFGLTRVGRIDPRLQGRIQRLQALVGVAKIRRDPPQVTQDFRLTGPRVPGKHIDRLLDRRRIPALCELHEREGAMDRVGVIVRRAG